MERGLIECAKEYRKGEKRGEKEEGGAVGLPHVCRTA